ncbi:MAG: hypothetical protein HY553_22545 [Elusimicrobia bacterium]|nr:hypothetical protein [Elusimicrobiota bacterium]
MLCSAAAWAAPTRGWAAPPAPRVVAPSLESLVRDSRAAYFRGDFEDSAQLAMEVLLEEPSHTEARDLLRLAAKVLAEQDVDRVQRERRQLLQSIQEAQARREEDKRLERELLKKEEGELAERLAKVEKDRPLWSAWTRAHVAHGEWLEAYGLIFQVKDQFPKEAWVEPQLDRLRFALRGGGANLDARAPEYREAVLAYAAFADGKYKEAAGLWRSALEKPPKGAALPRDVLERRITEALAKEAGAEPKPAPRRPVGKARLAAKKTERVPATTPAPVAAEPPPAEEREVQALYVQGLVQYGFGHVAAAAKTWEQVLKLDPKHPAARRALERARHELGVKP